MPSKVREFFHMANLVREKATACFFKGFTLTFKTNYIHTRQVTLDIVSHCSVEKHSEQYSLIKINSFNNYYGKPHANIQSLSSKTKN